MADFVCFIDRIFHFGFDELHDALFTVIGNSCQVGADDYGVKAAVLVVCNEVPAGHGVQDRGHGCLGLSLIHILTGHQPHPGTGRTMMGQVVEKVDITKVLEGIGVKHIRTVDALDLEQCVETVLEFSALEGVKAVIFKAPCIAIVKTTDVYKRQASHRGEYKTP